MQKFNDGMEVMSWWILGASTVLSSMAVALSRRKYCSTTTELNLVQEDQPFGFSILHIPSWTQRINLHSLSVLPLDAWHKKRPQLQASWQLWCFAQIVPCKLPAAPAQGPLFSNHSAVRPNSPLVAAKNAIFVL